MSTYLFILVLASLFCFRSAQPALANSLAPNGLPSAKEGSSQQNQANSLPPPVLNAVRQDLSVQTRIAPARFKLKQATRQTWPDGCLGLARADEVCTQALVEGWQVIMGDGQQTWVYRTDGAGRNIRLDSPKNAIESKD